MLVEFACQKVIANVFPYSNTVSGYIKVYPTSRMHLQGFIWKPSVQIQIFAGACHYRVLLHLAEKKLKSLGARQTRLFIWLLLSRSTNTTNWFGLALSAMNSTLKHCWCGWKRKQGSQHNRIPFIVWMLLSAAANILLRARVTAIGSIVETYDKKKKTHNCIWWISQLHFQLSSKSGAISHYWKGLYTEQNVDYATLLTDHT